MDADRIRRLEEQELDRPPDRTVLELLRPYLTDAELREFFETLAAGLAATEQADLIRDIWPGWSPEAIRLDREAADAALRLHLIMSRFGL